MDPVVKGDKKNGGTRAKPFWEKYSFLLKRLRSFNGAKIVTKPLDCLPLNIGGWPHVGLTPRRWSLASSLLLYKLLHSPETTILWMVGQVLNDFNL